MKHEPIIQKKPKKRPRRTSYNQFGLIVFTLIIILAISFFAYRLLVPPEERFVLDFYRYSIVSTRDFFETVAVMGEVTPQEFAAIRSSINGEVLELFVSEGQDVQKGDSIIRLFSDSLYSQREQAVKSLDNLRRSLDETKLEAEIDLEKKEYTVQTAKLNVEDKKRNLELNELLYEYGAISQKDLEAARQTVEGAERELEHAQWQLELSIKRHQLLCEEAMEKVLEAEQELAKIDALIAAQEIVAPFNGRILSIEVKPNDVIKQNDLLIEMANVTDQIVVAKIPATQANKVVAGQKAEISSGSLLFEGEVIYVAPQARQSTEGVTVRVEIASKEPTTNLRPYSGVNVSIETGVFKNSLSLPRGTYLTSGQHLFVYVIEDGKAVKRDVQFGMYQGNYVQVLRGLEEGEKVITSSYDQFRQLSEIEIVPEGGMEL